MSFQQGLSGLNGAAKSLDVIGNNIANASTVGFKGAQAQFADVYASSLNGAGGVTAGIGTKVSTIAQQFTQGNIESSNNSLDVAINGVQVCRRSTPAEDPTGVDLGPREVTVTIDLKSGPERATVWTNDLTHAYVHENSAYSS